MRSLLAAVTAVAFLANASLANAAESVTTPVPGWCTATPEVVLFELTDLVSDARCKSDASVRVDPHLVALVSEKLVYAGPREMGKPSGKEREVVFAWLPTPITDPDNPGQVVFAMNQYQSYVELKKANGIWMNAVSAVGEKTGELAAEQIFLIGPKWMKSGIAAGVKTGVDLAGAVAFQAPFAIMAPFTAGLSLMPSTAMYAEALFMAPTGTAHGASELVGGVKARNFEQALEGAAEFCGNVGIVLLAAAPVMEGANALIPPRTPISSLPKGVAPSTARIESQALVPYDAAFAAEQAASEARRLLGREPVTPGGREVMLHAADRMTNPPKGRAPMTLEEVDQVLDTGRIKKLNPNANTITVEQKAMPGKPQVVVDAETGTRVITVIKNTSKTTPKTP
jgi:hypothetical protein